MIILALFLLMQASITLRVTDPWGLPVAGAEVKAGEITATTSENGEVGLPATLPADFELQVTRAGFEPVRRTMSRWTGTQELQLKVGSLLTGLTVTATRTERLTTESPSSVTVLDSETVRTSPARAVDDMLRQVPGFTLLRRSGSVAAHPTSQGVSMRGIGASGASRTLVLADGVPLNDAFGTWVYWNRVPRAAIEAIEVMRGGASDLYGSAAVGGVIHLRTRKPQEKIFIGDLSFGERRLAQGSVYASDVHGDWGYSFAGEAFNTDGYLSTFIPPTATLPARAGAVDEPVASQYQTGVLTVERTIGSRVHGFSNFTYSNESRKNGTPLTRNDTQFRQMSLGADITHRRGRTTVQAYGGSESFDSTFSTVAQGRVSETLASTQHVPLGYGGLQQSTVLSFGRHSVVAGLEYRQARGISNEIQFRNNPATFIKNGGTQKTFGPFVEDVIELSRRASVALSLRWDHWKNTDIQSTEATKARWSPKIGGTFRVNSNVSLHAAGYDAFREPTLNELYRPFSVGNIVTQPNPLLTDERLRGGEAGADLETWQGRLHGRLSVYASRLSGTIANVSLSVTQQQRRNLGNSRARGLETELEIRPFRLWSLTGSYLFADSSVTNYPTQPALEGKRLPQIPRRQYSVQIQGSFLNDYRVNVQGRGSSLQYDDVNNGFPLDGYFAMDAYAARSLGSNLEAFVAGENLTNRTIQVTRTNVLLGLGMPRTVRAGINVRVGAR
jgi:outer membrane receptor protein involved in Fe transport